jgi:nicotinamidase-related amidase
MATTDKTALLIMDVQPGIVKRLADPEAYLAKITAAADEARRRQLPIVHVVVGFRPGFPEVSAENKSFSATKNSGGNSLVDPAPSLTPRDGEVVVRGLGARHIVLTGIATSGVVLSTLREAADKDYRITVLSDLCADMDDEVHKVLLEKVFPRQADVLSAQEWFATAETDK